MDIKERLALFYRRLEAEPPAVAADEALAIICRVLEEVEAQYYAVPRKEPPPLAFDGRMYPPQPDKVHLRPDGSLWVKTRRHRIVIRPDGGFVIYHTRIRAVEFRKRGRFE